MSNADKFFSQFSAAIANNTFLKLTLGSKRHPSAELRNVFVKPMLIKGELKISFNFRYNTRDEVKNFDGKTALDLIKEMLLKDFFNADLFLSDKTFYFSTSPAGNQKLRTKENDGVAKVAAVTFQHDKIKQRSVSTNAVWLQALGITNAGGNIKADKQHKFRQIDRYAGIMTGIFKDHSKNVNLKICDMASGKGYLSFALYDCLSTAGYDVSITGVEQRAELVKQCNEIAEATGFEKLEFIEGVIAEHELGEGETLIALHACDTATDDAIAKGIKAKAAYIICAPCCHKQVRKQMKPDNVLQTITVHGILLERQAEIVTDTIRALILEAYGYKTRVFEFVETANTPKNVMIAAARGSFTQARYDSNLRQVLELKSQFGLIQHYLETLL